MTPSDLSLLALVAITHRASLTAEDDRAHLSRSALWPLIAPAKPRRNSIGRTKFLATVKALAEDSPRLVWHKRDNAGGDRWIVSLLLDREDWEEILPGTFADALEAAAAHGFDTSTPLEDSIFRDYADADRRAGIAAELRDARPAPTHRRCPKCSKALPIVPREESEEDYSEESTTPPPPGDSFSSPTAPYCRDCTKTYGKERRTAARKAARTASRVVRTPFKAPVTPWEPEEDSEPTAAEVAAEVAVATARATADRLHRETATASAAAAIADRRAALDVLRLEIDALEEDARARYRPFTPGMPPAEVAEHVAKYGRILPGPLAEEALEAALSVLSRCRVEWEYSYSRGITYDHFRAPLPTFT